MSNYNRSTVEKIELFRTYFKGLDSAYGTYDPATGKYRLVKKHITHNTIYNHFKGLRPFGLYPLNGNITHVGVIDFDDNNPEKAIKFINRAKHYEISSYLERSKSKGYHVWIFCSNDGVPARMMRIVIKYILSEIESPNTEVFPKQDSISLHNIYGNFINAPLFGKYVPHGKTVFLNPYTLKHFPNQWDFLASINRIDTNHLKSIIELNDLDIHSNQFQKQLTSSSKVIGFSLPICIRRILYEGVGFNQRVACFRLAVHLKRIGLPIDSVLIILMDWRHKNRPKGDKRIITRKEIEEQTKWAYNREYTGYGCTEPVIMAFCDFKCPVKSN